MSYNNYLHSELDAELFNALRKKAHELYVKLDSPDSELKDRNAGSNLAGAISHQYYISETVPLIDKYVCHLAREFENKFFSFNKSRLYKSKTSSKLPELMCDDLWVNFQSKHEYNPPHIHSGLYSFVIWVNIPYDLEKEASNFPNAQSRINPASMFAFNTFTPDGRIEETLIPVDKSFEGKIFLFPANISHQVYPFTTSDDYRISIAGNITFKGI